MEQDNAERPSTSHAKDPGQGSCGYGNPGPRSTKCYVAKQGDKGKVTTTNDGHSPPYLRKQPSRGPSDGTRLIKPINVLFMVALLPISRLST